MRWRQPADPLLAEAIVASFHGSPDTSRRALARFSADAWKKTWFWLDASGLALYFFQNAKDRGFLDAVDWITTVRLLRKLVSNSERTAVLFDEYAALNHAFSRRRIIFANLKGFTLTPHSCPSPELRLQLDFDFLVASDSFDACRSVLEERGYQLQAATATDCEINFKAGNHAGSRQTDPYRITGSRSVELHFSLDGLAPHRSDECLQRLSVSQYRGQSFPALSPPDQLLCQALHILAHLRSAHTRLAWLLEFQHHVLARRDDTAFWHDVRQLAKSNPLLAAALGIATSITREIFGNMPQSSTLDWAEGSIPAGASLWLQQYGRRAVMADFPGTKLHILLDHELAHSLDAPRKFSRSGFLPAPRIPHLFSPPPRESLRQRFERWRLHALYITFRLRFHSVEGARAALAMIRWKQQRSRFLPPVEGAGALHTLAALDRDKGKTTA